MTPIAFLLGLTCTVGLGPVWIPYFKKLKFGQYIREDGPQDHLKKAGTPTFGGIMFVTSLLIVIAALGLFKKEVAFVLWATLGYGTVGFLDDYIKVVKKNNLGLRAWQKMLGLLLVTVGAYLLFLSQHVVVLPFNLGEWQSPLLVFVFFAFIATATTNAVNLTDGIDGLCGSVTLVVSLLFAYLAFTRDMSVLVLVNLTMAGSLVGYLVYNWYPAKVFMGDTGSLALGGFVLANAVLLNVEWFIPVFGLVYVLETLSVVIQVAVFKKTGKRVFKMAPLHHHFELMGWHEKRIVFTAASLTLAMSLVTTLLI